MNLFKIFMMACFGIITPIMAFMLANETKAKKNIVIGTTLPAHGLADPEVVAVLSKFKRDIWLVSAILMVIMLPIYFVEGMGPHMTVLMCWLILAMAVPMILYAVANTKLRKIKAQKGYLSPNAGRRIADLGVREGIRRPFSRLWFLPALAVGLLPVALAWFSLPRDEALGFVIAGVSISLCVLMSVFFYPLIYRQRMEVVGSDTAKNKSLSNIRILGWARMWLLIAWSTALLSLFMYLFRDNMLWAMISVGVYTAVIIAAAMAIEFSVRADQERLTAVASDSDYVDDDIFWPYGLFYYNKNDRHFFIMDRVGVNMGMNLAHPAGKITMLITLLLVLALPFFGIWMTKIETTPREALITEAGTLSVTHVNEQFEVPLDEITEIEILDKLPNARRNIGTGMDTLLEGKFSVEGYGSCTISLNPQMPPFIVIKTAEKCYIFNLMTAEETAEFAKLLPSPVPALPTTGE